MTIPNAPTPAGPLTRLSGVALLVIILGVVFYAPQFAERVQYSAMRGQLRARVEAAKEELGELAKNAELVKLSDTSRAFRLVAERVEPSVVHIDTAQTVRQRTTGFDEFFGLPGSSYRSIGQGSGVIVDTAGYIITNYHVIQDASQIEVALSDGRTIREVEVVGSDVLTDLAVLKIKADNLFAAELGDSKQLEVGDWVLAVGNPYGLDRTVTCGIVSAKQRRALAENSAYQSFLQTDAAVNPGNSGGPLVDVQGKVVGITTAIVGKSYQGISFAIPTEIVTTVYEHLRTRGSVPRGYLGVGLQEVTPELARQLQLGEVRGVLVTGVQPRSPAAKAGIEAGDVILSIEGEPINDPAELRQVVAGAKIGSSVKVRLVREGIEQTVSVTITQRPVTG
jgi:Do/DeqQ family serine protease